MHIFYCFSCLIGLSRTFSIMLKSSGESGHPCLLAELRNALYLIGEVLFYCHFSKCFYLENVFHFVRCFFINWYNHVCFSFFSINVVQLLRWISGKESTCQCRRHRFDPWVRNIPWKRKWQPTPVFLHGKFHGQRSLAGYSPQSHKESNMIEHACVNVQYIYLFSCVKSPLHS